MPVISALRFLFPKFKGDPILLQYALRVLEHHPVEVTFFYIPQVVQALRTDDLGECSVKKGTQGSTAHLDRLIRRLRRAFHFRNVPNLAAVLPSDHLEYEGQRLPRGRRRGGELFRLAPSQLDADYSET